MSQCCHCDGYYGPNFKLPVCATCHAFLYPDDAFLQPTKTDDEDSGNEEPKEPADYYQLQQQKEDLQEPTNFPPYVNIGNLELSSTGSSGFNSVHNGRDTLQEQINLLACPRPPDNLDPGVIDRLPPEVLLLVFQLLDDVTLWSVSQVCRRWRQLVLNYVTEEDWHRFIKNRWPLFFPIYEVTSWRQVYMKLIESAPCQLCLRQMTLSSLASNSENSWRRNRLRNELKTLRSDPPEGIMAAPLDQMSPHWQAFIRGPAGSPYEGGTFFLYIQIPPSYPLCPPVVRFITKIFHPNVSHHGDIGIDSIQHNWSLALTISKILISIQSLLTDPYTKVCMEPKIGRLYEQNKAEFERLAKEWTWRHAMHDALIPEPVNISSSSSCLPACSVSFASKQDGQDSRHCYS